MKKVATRIVTVVLIEKFTVYVCVDWSLKILIIFNTYQIFNQLSILQKFLFWHLECHKKIKHTYSHLLSKTIGTPAHSCALLHTKKLSRFDGCLASLATLVGISNIFFVNFKGTLFSYKYMRQFLNIFAHCGSIRAVRTHLTRDDERIPGKKILLSNLYTMGHELQKCQFFFFQKKILLCAALLCPWCPSVLEFFKKTFFWIEIPLWYHCSNQSHKLTG